MASRHSTTSKQRWNNVVYINVEIYDVEQRQINIFYFNVDLNNVRQRWSNVVIFNVNFHNVGSWATVKLRCEYDHLKDIKIKPTVKNKIMFLSLKEYTGLKIFFNLFFILIKRISSKRVAKLFKCQQVFNFTRRQVQAHYDCPSFNFINIF